MRVVCVYRENSEHGREVTEWLETFDRRIQKEVEIVDPDSVYGGDFVSAYDVVEYPTFLALDDNGAVLDQWRGTPLPRIDEVSYYAAEKRNI